MNLKMPWFQLVLRFENAKDQVTYTVASTGSWSWRVKDFTYEKTLAK